MQRAIPDEDKSRVVRYLPPLMEIEGDGVRALDASQTKSNIRGQHPERAERAIDVKPNGFPPRDIGNGGQRIDRSGIDGAGSPGDEERRQPGTLVDGDGFLECPRIHLESIVQDRKSTRLNSSHLGISYAVFCL